MSNLRSVFWEAHVDEELSRVQVTSDRLGAETIVGHRCLRTRGHRDWRERVNELHVCTCRVPASYYQFMGDIKC
jgi:hypothetical protein